jgi:hypothetical protein
MKALMIEDKSPAASATSGALRGAGIEVVCCRKVDDGLACRALYGEACPLEGGTVDAVVAVRSWDDFITTNGANRSEIPSLGEEGIVCGIRKHIPLVMVCDTGDPWGGPFDQWIEESCVHEEVADTIRDLVQTPSDTHSKVATEAMASLMELMGIDGNPRASVVRSDGRLSVRARIPSRASTSIATEVRDALSVKVHDALHAFDPWVKTIDVSFGD